MDQVETANVAAIVEDIRKNHRQRTRKSKLYKDIRSQMEFYFSDANLMKQRVMRTIVQESEFVPLNIFVEKFNKLIQLTKNVEDVRRALKKSEKLELSDDGAGVKRKVAFDDSKAKDEGAVENCTIYVENIPLHVDHVWIEKIFQEFGQVAYISLPKFKRSRQPKGFAFVEFDDEDAVKRCLEAFGEMGACLPTNIDPSALMSITTFNDDEPKPTVKAEGINLRKRKAQNESKDIGNGNDEVAEKKSRGKGKTVSGCSDSREEPIEEEISRNVIFPVQVQPDQKRIENGTTQAKEESVNENVSPKSGIENTPAAAVDAKIGKKKRRRKKNTPGCDEKLESDLIHLKILPKRNWRQLRNRYLNLQRENFGKLKAQMRACAAGRRPSFTPEQTSSGQYKSVCVRIDLSAKEESKEALVTKISTELCPPDWSNFVKYVDYDGAGTQVIVRLDGGPSAGSAIRDFVEAGNRIFQSARIMSGTETDEYWALSRAKLKEQKKLKMRGKDHLLNRATKLASSHIHFDTNNEGQESV